ncbi:hypothetical protein DFH06DRAFT_1391125 [Mycena polygramma]|nr:hypothetical protein DFH06DRAFT_1391125 [Mycena polygramma]
MQFNVSFITSALLASASLALSATLTGFAGADCSGTQGESFNVNAGECGTLGGGSTKSISYSGVPNSISFFQSGGTNDACTNGAQLTLGGGSGCGTAPDGFNWESISVS